MSIIEIPAASGAEESVQPLFDRVKSIIGFVPKTTRMLGTSPFLLSQWWEYINYFHVQHSAFSRDFLTYVRLLAAVHGEFPFCIEFNSATLENTSRHTHADIAEIIRDPSRAHLPDGERALLLFVLRAIGEPEEVTAEDVQALRDIGWSDEHIFEATYYGAWMLLIGLLFNAFKMHEEE